MEAGHKGKLHAASTSKELGRSEVLLILVCIADGAAVGCKALPLPAPGLCARDLKTPFQAAPPYCLRKICYPLLQIGMSPGEVQVAELLQGMWTAWHSGFGAASTAALPGSRLHDAAQTAAVRSILAEATSSVQHHELKALQLQLAARQMRRWGTRLGACQ